MASTIAPDKHADNLNLAAVFQTFRAAAEAQQPLICGVTVMVK
jgi:hypothetical protein